MIWDELFVFKEENVYLLINSEFYCQPYTKISNILNAHNAVRTLA